MIEGLAPQGWSIATQGGGPSKPVRIGPSCKWPHTHVFPQGLAEGKGVVLFRDALVGLASLASWSGCNMSVGATKHLEAARK